MRFFLTFSLLASLLFISACGGGEAKEAKDFVEVRDEVTSAWAKELDSNPNEVGIDNMRKIFDAKKADLIAKKDAFLKVSDKASSDSWRRVSDTNSMESKLADAAIQKTASASAAAHTKLLELIKDYEAAVKVPNLI